MSALLLLLLQDCPGKCVDDHGVHVFVLGYVFASSLACLLLLAIAMVRRWRRDRSETEYRERLRQRMPPATSTFYPWNRKRGGR